jgi:RND family efflux transporter MFP subunit
MKGRIIGVGLGIALLALIGVRIVAGRKAASALQTQSTEEVVVVRVGRVERSNLGERVLLTGTVKPQNEVDVFSKVPGRIDKLNVQVGDRVKAGTLLGTMEAKEIAWQARAADAALEVAKANLQGAELDAQRTETLFQGGSAPQAQLDAARMRLSLAKAQVAQAEAAAGLARQQVQNARIESPIAGTVTRRPVNVGNQVGPQSPLFTVQDVATLKMDTSVDAMVFHRLVKGQRAQVTVDALPGQSFRAEVKLLSPTLDPSTRRAAVEIAVENERGALMPHMFAQATISVGELKNVLVVRREAILPAAGGPLTYVVSNGVARAVRPKLGATDGERWVVLEGLEEGQVVATSALGSLSDGMKVSAAEDDSPDERSQVVGGGAP